MGFFWPFKKKIGKIEEAIETPDPFPTPPPEAVPLHDKQLKGTEKWKLEPFEKMELAKMIAWFWSTKDIQAFAIEKWGKQLSQQNIDMNYRKAPKWQPIIEKFREEYNKSVLDIPLANKKKRLEELQKMFEKHIENSRLDKAQSILRDAREEMTEKFGEVNFNYTNVNHTEYHGMSDEALMQEKMKTIEQLQKVKKLKDRIERKELITDEGVENERIELE